ncbi:hypothetical protein ABFV05_019891 [Capra hircus]
MRLPGELKAAICLREVEGRVLLGVGGGGSEGELGDEAGPSRDRELQSVAAFGAGVTPVWLSAPRCPELSALASGPRQAEQVCGSTCQVLQQLTLQQESGGGGDNQDRLRSSDAQRGTSAEKSHHGKCQRRK